MLGYVRRLVLLVGLIASPANAQNDFTINIFFGFDFVLQPLAIKWACGGEREADLSRIETLIDAFPEDAECAELQEIVDTLSKLSEAPPNLTQLLGGEISLQQAARLCPAALPLNIEWLTPEVLSSGDEGMSEEQKIVWEIFYKIVETL